MKNIFITTIGFILALFLTQSCQRNMRENISIDKVITFFSLSQKNILFHYGVANYFSIIDRAKGDSIKIVGVDFGDKGIPDEYKEDWEKIIQRGYYCMDETPVTNGNYIAFDIINPGNPDCFLYSINDDVMKRI